MTRNQVTRIYKTTGVVITSARRLLGIKLRVTGASMLPDQPTVYLVNHFTKLETFLMPYVIYHARRVMVHTLAHDGIFKGFLNWYWRGVGVHSVKMPQRNRTIIGELMRGQYDWVIYPEGGLIKNKKLVRGRRLHLEHPSRSGPPRTGGALLALRAELAKQAVRDAADNGREDGLAVFADLFSTAGPAALAEADTVIVPVSITYHNLKPGANMFTRLAKMFTRALDPRTEEELQIEGNILLGRTEINVHFGDPINVRTFIEQRRRLLADADELASAGRTSSRALRKAASTLTQRAMRSLYNHLEISLDHLVSYGLRAVRRDVVDMHRFHQAMYLAAMGLRDHKELRLHPVLTNGIRALAGGGELEDLTQIIDRAVREGVVTREAGMYRIHRGVQQEPIGFHEIRVKGITRMIANELEPIRPATSVIDHAVNINEDKLSAAVAKTLREQDVSDYQAARSRWVDGNLRGGHAKPVSYGEPVFLPARGSKHGVVLVHGYRANPEQMRPLALWLREQGSSVYVVRLEGHGTSPAHLTDVRWTQWLENVLSGIAVLRHHADHVAVGGLSLGGLLALLSAARRPDAVASVFSINAPVQLRDRRAGLVPAIVQANTTLRRLGLRRSYAMRPSGSENPEISYDVDYLRGVREVRRVISATRRSLGEVRSRALVIQAVNDPTVAPSSGRRIIEAIGSEASTLIEPDMDRHTIIRGPGAQDIFDAIGAFLYETALERPH